LLRFARNDRTPCVIARSETTKQAFSVMLTKQYYLYFLTNWNNKVLYVGVTNDLRRRVYEHKHGLKEGFTRRYNAHKLVYYEMCEEIGGAILREKQIKGGSRRKKNSLVEKFNPEWKDLWDKL
jgi:putative endonuclease